MQNRIDSLVGRSFIFSTLKYKVKKAKIINGNAVIITDRKPFNFYPAEFNDWYRNIQICEDSEDKIMVPSKVINEWIPPVKIENVPSPLQVEIVVAESNAQKVSNKLMEVFETLAESPTEETYKKAAAMVNVSNSIVAVQMAQIKFLSLKK